LEYSILVEYATLEKNYLTKRKKMRQLIFATLLCIPRKIRIHELSKTQTLCGNQPYIYIERDRESDYGVLQNPETLCALHFIFNFKSEIIDSNRSI
jgi:hypothetical protein